MIARTWVGEVPSDRSEEYLRLMRAVALPAHRKTPGNRGAWALRQERGDRTRFTLLSFWDSTDSVAAFAGDDLSQVHYFDFDADLLIEMSPCADHFELYDR